MVVFSVVCSRYQYLPGLLPGRWPGPAFARLKVKTPSSVVTTGPKRETEVSALFSCEAGVTVRPHTRRRERRPIYRGLGGAGFLTDLLTLGTYG